MSAAYATPGVYVEEISTLPPSVAEISTAIPAFIGTTETHLKEGEVVVQDVNSLREFEEKFGRAPAAEWTVAFDATTQSFSISGLEDLPFERFSEPKNVLWYAIDLYFRNGGGRCYVVSVGPASVAGSSTAKADLLKGVDALERYDEPTLVIIPEAARLGDGDYGELCQKALSHAAKMKDRFVILDTKTSGLRGFTTADLEAIRGALGATNLDRGAIFYPHLLTTLGHRFTEDKIQITGLPAPSGPSGGGSAQPTNAASGGSGDSLSPAPPAATGQAATVTLASLAQTQTSHHNQIKKLLGEQRVILPPSAAIAGVIASVDRDRGVWKAPANVSLQAVVGPTVQVTDDQQGLLNIDPTTGKSINAIRAFAGKGTLVWGARTLAGNDNEWRYISVRRLFITIEEAVKKATAFAVFEANDTSTWLKVKGMIDSYLYTLWEKGALRGTKAEDAYFVNVGLNKTMTQDDILNGRLIVEIGLAAVRPAEFIILRFSHKLAQ
jgi:phage tail sheath protein FI